MARIAGVDLPREKRIEIGLTYVYGIGQPSAIRILKEAGVNPDTRVRDLTDDEVAKIREIIAESQTVEGDLRREIALNIKRLTEIGCYRGIRHRRGLPVSCLLYTSVRDFRGVKANSFDGRGNYTMGIKEQLIFPEIEYDKVDKIRGMDIIFVTTAHTDEEARELLRLYGMPFAK